MRKHELIHLHGLLAEIARFCDQEGEASLDLTEYQTKETRPMSIKDPKDAHKEAVFALAEGLATSLQDEADTDPSEPVSATAG